MHSEETYDGNYPYIPLSMFLFFPTKTDDFHTGEGKTFKRYIFEGGALQKMTDFQKEQENKFQKYMEEKKHKLSKDTLEEPFWNRSSRYRWLLSLRFDPKRTLKEMNRFTEYLKTNRFDVTSKAEENLKAGIIYISGRDSSYRPIIVFDFDKMIKLKLTAEEIIEAQKFFVQFVLQNFLLPGQAETTIAIVDCGYRNIISMLTVLKDCMSFLQGTFRCRMKAAYLLKIPPSASIVWAFVKNFVNEETLKRIFMLDGQTVDLLLQSTHPSQIERKYGGSQENISQFWPIRKVSELDNSQYHLEDEPSPLISIQKYQQKFRQGKLKGYKICQKLLQQQTMTTKYEEFVTQDVIMQNSKKYENEKQEILDKTMYAEEKQPVQPELGNLQSMDWFKLQQLMGKP